MTKRVDVLTYMPGVDDPLDVAFNAIGRGNIDKIDVFNNRVLVVTAPHPAQTASGIFFADKTVEEQRFQEKIGIILKIGENAFKPDENYTWSDPPQVGDFIFYRVTDSMELSVNNVSCRVIGDGHIIGKVASLDIIW